MQPGASQTEDRLVLLSMIDGLGACTKEQLMRFSLEAQLMAQFRFLLAVGDLTEEGLAREADLPEGRVLVLTPEGREALRLFGDTLRPSVQERLKENVPHWRRRFMDERQLPAEWREEAGGYRVVLRALEQGQELLRIELPAVTRQQAQRFCRRWPENAGALY